jgi:signal transduction histidine kinase
VSACRRASPVTAQQGLVVHQLALQLALQVADGLAARCTELTEHWRTQARAVAPRATGSGIAGDPERSARLCSAVVTALRGDARCKDDVMRAGWELGDVAFATGSSLHHLLKEVDLLAAILLYAAQQVAAEAPQATAADGISVARRLSGVMSLLVLAASKGFMNAYLGEQQQRYRALRHDLRNPIGTIKGAVSLMEDPTVSPEMRNDPRFRTMVVRNAGTLDAMIGDRLSDAATLGPALARHEVSLRDVALAVRRDLRDEASEAGCEVDVAGDLPVVRTDSTSFELALRSLVSTALCTAEPGTTVHVGLRQLRDRIATVEVVVDTPRLGVGDGSDALDFARELSLLAGGKVWHEGSTLCLEVPVSPPAEAVHDRARAD